MYHDYNSILILSRIYKLVYPSKEYTYNKYNTYLYPSKEYKILRFFTQTRSIQSEHIIEVTHNYKKSFYHSCRKNRKSSGYK